MKLYYSPGACSLACHIVLEEIAIPFEAQRVDIGQGEHLAAPYLTINPAGRLPALEEDGSVLTEATAILISLALRYPEAGLIPKQADRMLETLAWLSSTVHPLYGALWRPGRMFAEEERRGALSAAARAQLPPVYERFAERLGTQGWLAGEAFTLADAYGIVFFRWANRIGIPVSDTLTDWARRVEVRPSVQRALEREGISLWS
ncbi:glutathione S-transferase family protein [Lacibacterium aquatile]|uniref:Glutathione S-transferase family protein n=1 Tax=Lacibacterium aquatile TaxID=1168082 RepID=A0ABW5DUE6_9PROT